MSEHDLDLFNIRTIVCVNEGHHNAYINDIRDILDRLRALEKRAARIASKQFNRMQRAVYDLSEWAVRAAKTIAVPFKMRL